MFGRAHAATKGKKVAPVENTMRYIDEELAKLEPIGDEAKRIAGKLREIRQDFIDLSGVRHDDLLGGADALNIRQFQNVLSDWTRKLHGSGTWIEGMDKGHEKVILRGFVDALNRDLDEVIKSGGTRAEAAGNLRRARALYAEHQEVIENARNIVLDNLVTAGD